MNIVYCIKNYVGEKPFQKFKVNDSYQIKCTTDDIIIISFYEDPKWANNIVFKFKSSEIGLDFPIFEEYLANLKEYRKLKLQNFFEKN